MTRLRRRRWLRDISNWEPPPPPPPPEPEVNPNGGHYPWLSLADQERIFEAGVRNRPGLHSWLLLGPSPLDDGVGRAHDNVLARRELTEDAARSLALFGSVTFGIDRSSEADLPRRIFVVRGRRPERVTSVELRRQWSGCDCPACVARLIIDDVGGDISHESFQEFHRHCTQPVPAEGTEYAATLHAAVRNLADEIVRSFARPIVRMILRDVFKPVMDSVIDATYAMQTFAEVTRDAVGLARRLARAFLMAIRMCAARIAPKPTDKYIPLCRIPYYLKRIQV
jgi:hypothetical protein